GLRWLLPVAQSLVDSASATVRHPHRGVPGTGARDGPGPVRTHPMQVAVSHPIPTGTGGGVDRAAEARLDVRAVGRSVLRKAPEVPGPDDPRSRREGSVPPASPLSSGELGRAGETEVRVG